MISSLNVISSTNTYAQTYTTIEEAQKAHPYAQFKTNRSDGTFMYTYGGSNVQSKDNTTRSNRLENHSFIKKRNANSIKNNQPSSHETSGDNSSQTFTKTNDSLPMAPGPHNIHNNLGYPVTTNDTPILEPSPPVTNLFPSEIENEDYKDLNKAYKKDDHGMITYIDMDILYDELQLDEFNEKAQTIDGRPLAIGNGKIIDTPLFTSKNNLYTSGQCTWYVFDKRAKDGKTISTFWGDARNWAGQALASGFKVDHKPTAGSILQTVNGPYGHVAYVERVNLDGSIFISEMNWIAPYITSTRTISSSEVSSYNYIH
ncbi:CHAP domain-containing protein [Staphylococcus marylandisciuri]